MVKERKKTWRNDKRYLGRAGAWWDHKLLLAISTEAAEKAFQQTCEARGKVSANRFLASVRACLQAAWRLNKVVDNVAARVSFLPENPPRARDARRPVNSARSALGLRPPCRFSSGAA